jgi:hypothetical protein
LKKRSTPLKKKAVKGMKMRTLMKKVSSNFWPDVPLQNVSQAALEPVLKISHPIITTRSWKIIKLKD